MKPHRGFEDRARLVDPELAVTSSRWCLHFASYYQSQVPPSPEEGEGPSVLPDGAHGPSPTWGGQRREAAVWKGPSRKTPILVPPRRACREE